MPCFPDVLRLPLTSTINWHQIPTWLIFAALTEEQLSGIYAAKYTTRFRAGPTNAQLRNIRKEKTTMININGSLQGISCQLPLLPSSVSRLFLGKAYLDIETQTLRVSPKGLEVVSV